MDNTGRPDEHEYHLYQELRRGAMSRRDFLRRAGIAGLSIPAIGAILAEAGLGVGNAAASPLRSLSGAAIKRGGTGRVGISVPAAAPDPVTMADEGSIITTQIAGEYLAWPLTNYELVPRLATSWTSSGPSTWTFKLRPGVKFQNGQPMTADDVVATFERLVSKAVSNSNFTGILAPGQIQKVDPLTVTFHLSKPFVDFPYLVSGFNYNAIILPANYKAGSFTSGTYGTGPYQIQSYSSGQKATYVKNPNYWGTGMPYMDGMTLTYYQDNTSQVLAMQGGNLDVLPIAPYGSEALYADAKFNKLKAPSSGYRTLQMRVDQAPFNDVRVRQALAYTINRQSLITGLLQGFGEVGNDHAFAPVFPISKEALSIPQRNQDIAKAKALLTAAGHHNGLDVTLTTESYLEIPEYATVLKQEAKAAGFNIKLNVEQQNAYYGSGANQPWLSVPLGITDWGARGVASQVILPAFTSNGVWNSAHWKNATFDSLVNQLNASEDNSTRMSLAKKAATLQHDQVPDIIAFWFIEVRIVGQNVHGLTAGPAEWFDPRAMWLA